MLENGYPQTLLCVEKSLEEIQGINIQKIPLRRLDVLCFSKKEHKPLLIIECKAHPVDKKALDQLVSYNHFIKSPFIALADPFQILTGWYDVKSEKYQFTKGLLSYENLEKALQ